MKRKETFKLKSPSLKALIGKIPIASYLLRKGQKSVSYPGDHKARRHVGNVVTHQAAGVPKIGHVSLTCL